LAADGSRAPSNAQMRRVADDPGGLDLIGAPEGFDALVMADIVKARKGLSVFVARDGARLSAFADAFRFFAPTVEVMTFPAWDCLPYDRIGPSPGVAAQRMATLAKLATGVDAKTPMLLVTTVPALLQRVPPRDVISQASYSARVGNSVNIDDLERYFAVNGYARASTVSEKGEFAIRGGVIDVFPPTAEEPVRLDLFGDTLESIRGFDPETQRSTRQLKDVSLLPVSEALLDKAAISRFRTGYLENFGAPGDDPLYATVSEGARRAGMEHWLPLFYPSLATLLDYLPADAVIGLDHLSREARDERMAMIADAYNARAQTDRKVHYHPLEPDKLYLTKDEWQAKLAARATRRFSSFQEAEGEAVIDMGARQGRSFAPERQRRQRQPVRGHRRARQGAGGARQAGAVRLLVGRLVRSPGLDAGRPWSEEHQPRALLGRRAIRRSEDSPARGPAAGGRVRDRQPGRRVRDRHPGRPPVAATPKETGVQLPGRGLGPDPGRPGRPYRPWHRPLRGPEDPGGPGRAARHAWSCSTAPRPSSTCRSRISTC
jgi:transcription-repair coupling factor (superfamily II helicase)